MTMHTTPEPHIPGIYAGDGECIECNALCTCGNAAMPGAHVCEWCDQWQDEAPHVGHVMPLTGAWYCDTCDSAYCVMA